MARVPFVPYSQDYADVFEFCGISLPTSEFGGETGWDPAAFSAAAISAKEYLDENLNDENADIFETWYDKLEHYSVFYWSTEAYNVG